MKLIDMKKFERINFEKGVNLKVSENEFVYIKISELSENGKQFIKRLAIMSKQNQVKRKVSTVFHKGNDNLAETKQEDIAIMLKLLQYRNLEQMDFEII